MMAWQTVIFLWIERKLIDNIPNKIPHNSLYTLEEFKGADLLFSHMTKVALTINQSACEGIFDILRKPKLRELTTYLYL